MGVGYLKRTTESIAVDAAVPADKLAGAFPTGGTAVSSPAGLTIGAGTPLAEAVRFTVSGGTAGVTYSLTATITLSDGRTVTELVEVAVADEPLNPDPVVGIDGYPPTVCFTNREALEGLLSIVGLELRLDDDGSGNINPRERKAINRLAYVASGWVRMFCMAYDVNDLLQSWIVWHYATVAYARYLCLREGNPIPAGLWELYAEAEKYLEKVQAGQIFLTEIPTSIDPAPSWSNVRMDPVYTTSPLRVQRKGSDRSHADFPRRQDTGDKYIVELDA